MQILYTDDLCAGEKVFFAATGVSDGELLRGVRYFAGGASSNSIVMRSTTGTGAHAATLLLLPQAVGTTHRLPSRICLHLAVG